MNIGMLWFDNDSKTDLATKIHQAADYYRNKYGKTPDMCFVHPSMVENVTYQGNGIELRTSRSVLPNHLWIGVNNAS